MSTIYVLSDPETRRERYKPGVHTGTLENLKSRYSTSIPCPLVHFFLQTPHACYIEGEIKRIFKDKREVNWRGNLTEWILYPVHEIMNVLVYLLFKEQENAKMWQEPPIQVALPQMPKVQSDSQSVKNEELIIQTLEEKLNVFDTLEKVAIPDPDGKIDRAKFNRIVDIRTGTPWINVGDIMTSIGIISRKIGDWYYPGYRFQPWMENVPKDKGSLRAAIGKFSKIID